MTATRVQTVTRSEFLEYCSATFKTLPEKFGTRRGKKGVLPQQRQARLEFWETELKRLYDQGAIGRRQLAWSCPFVPGFKKTRYRPGGLA
jgi:hypothetical protein